MNAEKNGLHLFGHSHRTAPLAIREKLALSEDKVDALYESLNALNGLTEFLVLSTCNRTELYTVSRNDGIVEKIETLLSDFHQFDLKDLSRYCFHKKDIEAVRHLFEVSAGIDSQIVGETEILGQLKRAYQHAVDQTSVGPVLHRVFQKSFQSAKWIRTNTAIGRGQVSIGNIAVNLALRIFGKLEKARIFVIGTGEVGGKTATALKNRGANDIAVTSRTIQKAEALAGAIKGRVLDFKDFEKDLSRFDIIICSTSAHHALLSRDKIAETMRKRPQKPLFLIDMAVPRNVEAGCPDLTNVYLYNLDDLSRIANENLKERESEIDHCKEILQAKAVRVWDSLSA